LELREQTVEQTGKHQLRAWKSDLRTALISSFDFFCISISCTRVRIASVL
jgi:hypothetical protein